MDFDLSEAEKKFRDEVRAWLVGTPEQVAGRMREFAGLGVDLFMLQHFLLDDSEALRMLAEEVIPAVA